MVRTPCGPFGASALDGFAENGEGSIGRDANAFSIALQKNSRPARMRSLPRCPRFYFCFLVQSFSAERAFKKTHFQRRMGADSKGAETESHPETRAYR